MNMIKAASAIFVAALIAGLFCLPDSAQQVRAGTQPPIMAKGDRLPIHTAAGCSQRAWPYYDSACLITPTPVRAARLVSAVRSD
jgi:hypothetical protein